MKKMMLIIGLMGSTAALAEGVPVKSPPVTYDPPSVVVEQNAGPVTTTSRADSVSSAANVTTIDAYNAGVTNQTTTTISNPRQAPALGQGSFAIQGCPVAGNAGGSNTNGAAFLGIAFTPAQCYDFMLAQSYQALGAYRAACEVLNTSKAGRRAKKRGVELPVCYPPDPIVPPAPAPLLPAAITIEVKDDAKCDEKVNRVFERCVSK
jgi:hypothetical protein